jgi:hypothetical protein
VIGADPPIIPSARPATTAGGNARLAILPFWAASLTCLRWQTHCDRLADSRAAWIAGKSKAISKPMMPKTTSISINVKAR